MAATVPLLKSANNFYLNFIVEGLLQQLTDFCTQKHELIVVAPALFESIRELLPAEV